jgi:hypothetical protein
MLDKIWVVENVTPCSLVDTYQIITSHNLQSQELRPMSHERRNVWAEILKGKTEMNRRYSGFHVTVNVDCGRLE